jgi:hypothetical protein
MSFIIILFGFSRLYREPENNPWVSRRLVFLWSDKKRRRGQGRGRR